MGTRPSYDDLTTLLSEGLDLCVRARQLDRAINETNMAEHFPESAAMYPDHYRPCMTPHLWIQDQYDKDLADWERRARETMEKVVWRPTPPGLD